ncbi:hypothetical protein IE53DRAFT_70853 [Violaceomyces palustris]|uniref:Uncharacterized protein n=1 Tax=Violaceomyces palustris TaxID=1673888 RepID=A0ACD0P8X7_9BASI|nr:hypothetical protein IE53DRAFT_70853 [Violaceomyces palustris]
MAISSPKPAANGSTPKQAKLSFSSNAAAPATPTQVFDLTFEEDDSELSELEDINTPPPQEPLKAKPSEKQTGSASKKASAQRPKPKKRPSLPEAQIESPGPGSAKKAKVAAERKASTSTPGEAKASSSKTTPDGEKKGRTYIAKDGTLKIKALPGEGDNCHHHNSYCPSKLLRCTAMRGDRRCTAKYCYTVLKRFYNLDPDVIVQSGRVFLQDESGHCPASEAKYAWKCPRCKGTCKCSLCRKKLGLPPLGRTEPAGEEKETKADEAREKPGKKPAKKKTEKEEKLAVAKSPKSGDKATGADKKGKGKTKGNEGKKVQSTLQKSHANAKNQAKVKGAAKELSLSPSKRRQSALLRPLKAPTAVPSPNCELIGTPLKPENLRARMWLYETLVRFDVIGLPRSVLNNLDRFDNWTHRLVQDVLATVLRFVAGLSNIEKGNPAKNTTKAVHAFRKHGHSLTRGEPWVETRNMLEFLGYRIEELPKVQHSELFVEDEASPEPVIQRRMTRGRRIQEDEDFELARRESLANSRSRTEDSDVSASESRASSPDPVALEEPVEAPDLEGKVAILTALIEVALMTDKIAEELKGAPDSIAALEKTAKVEAVKMEKEQAERLVELNKRAPSIVSEEYAKWKAERTELWRDYHWRQLDARVFSELQCDTHALRTGPIGHDVDGREYWHLREYQERMPRHTEGRWSWCLIVLGKPFPKNPRPTITQEDAGEGQGEGQKGGPGGSFPPTPSTCPSKAQVNAEVEGMELDVTTPPGTPSKVSDEKEKAHAGAGGVVAAKGDAGKTEKEKEAIEIDDEEEDDDPDRSDVVCMGTNDPLVIQATIDFIHYRLARKEYEENVIQKRKAEAETLTKKERNLLKEDQELRKGRIQELVKGLMKSKEYFAWHRDEVEKIWK